MGKNILVVVDMQNDFIDGALGSKEAQAIVPNVIREIESGKYDYIYFTQDTHDDNYLETLEGKNLPIKHCIRNTDGWELNTDILDRKMTVVKSQRIIKDTFGSSNLITEFVLKKTSIESITFVGLCTDICVVSNALLSRAALPNVPMYYVKDACAGTTLEKHEAACSVMESCQIFNLN